MSSDPPGQPSVWDMAHHQIKGWEYLKLFQEGGVLEGFSGLSSYYPPLYLQEALVMRTEPDLLPLLGSVLAIHVVWTLLDNRPPVWDMAHHQIKGWEYLKLFQEGGVLEGFSGLSSYYPPLYYLQEALVMRFWTEPDLLPLLANLPGLLLLACCTRALALQCLLPARTAVWAGLLPLLLPLVAWTSRVSLLDVSLCGWVVASFYLLVRSDLLLKRSPSLLLGLVAAAGLLTKWTFVLFLLFPVAYCLLKSEDRKRSVLNLLDAGDPFRAPLVLWWYLPNLQALLGLRFQTTSEAAVWEQDPGIGSLLGWVYYPRVLASYYLFPDPLTLLFVWALARLWARRDQLPSALQLILVGGARNYETIVQLIAKTTTAKGLKVTRRLDRRKYPTGRKVSNEEMKRIHIRPNQFHGEWNYVIEPSSTRELWKLPLFIYAAYPPSSQGSSLRHAPGLPGSATADLRLGILSCRTGYLCIRVLPVSYPIFLPPHGSSKDRAI